MNLPVSDSSALDRLLRALADQLRLRDTAFDLVIVGGSALIAQGFVERATRDIDVVAIYYPRGRFGHAEPLPEALIEARDQVARDFGIPQDWLNGGPTSLLDHSGLPEGFRARMITRVINPWLTIRLASRLDLIHFKLFALADQGPGKHEEDLRRLNATDDELVRAARWTQTHDPSPGFAQLVQAALRLMGVSDQSL